MPTPTELCVRIRNTSAIPLRAAYLHGPYTLYGACYPSTFDPNVKRETSWDAGIPTFEPNLKAGGSWQSRLTIPENIREIAGKANVRRTTEGKIPSFTWIIEVSSQVIFSTSATVHYELLVGRDESSVELGFSGSAVQASTTPGHLQNHQKGGRNKDRHSTAQREGVLSKAVTLVVDDTESLWNKPVLPEWDDEGKHRGKKREGSEHVQAHVHSSASGGDETQKDTDQATKEQIERRPKKVHLVVLTHGLHSNLRADLLYLKESIDAAAKQAREDSRKRKTALKSRNPAHVDHSGGKLGQGDEAASMSEASTAPLSGGQDELKACVDVDSEDEEEVIVRGFSGNAVRTEKGIQYLGKRLAKYVLSMTYPDQPFLPVKKSVKKKFSQVFTNDQPSRLEGHPASHDHSSTHYEPKTPHHLAYKITSISFVAHSLGGLTQTYAIAYIHKHSPQFFRLIKPINFVAMASPFLGLSNENPLYVKFALDFGLVGRTGQDLGLTWRGSTMVRSGWGAMIGGIGSGAQGAHRQPDPGAKPLLRILPTGPAHPVLQLFRNRTVYSNVVNDGIVPLRTSCLLFLDWGGLGRVQKARRENGLVGTVAGWGWAELTGANSSSHARVRRDYGSDSPVDESGEEGRGRSQSRAKQAVVPQPTANATDDDAATTSSQDPEGHPFFDGHLFQDEAEEDSDKVKVQSPTQSTHPLGGLFDFLRPNQPKTQHHSPKQRKIYNRSQTMRSELEEGASQSSVSTDGLTSPNRLNAARGESANEGQEDVFAPPKTTFFESAGDILNPPLPSKEFIVNPASRPRTIFHDRVYHPGDIPPPPPKKRMSFGRSFSSDASRGGSISDATYRPRGSSIPDTSGMKVEEKIARAYHHDLSWRKVLVRLEPDAHNNIIVRRMFSNAYGWPVIKHLVDTHFADTYAATTADEHEPNEDRAKPMQEPVGEHGEELKARDEKQLLRTDSEKREEKDHVSDLQSIANGSMSSNVGRPKIWREDSAQWDDALFEVTDDEDDIDSPIEARRQRSFSLPENSHTSDSRSDEGAWQGEITGFLNTSPFSGKDPSIGHDPASSATPLVLHRGTTSVGLGKTVEKQLENLGKATSQEAAEGEQGRVSCISGDVARLSIGKGH